MRSPKNSEARLPRAGHGAQAPGRATSLKEDRFSFLAMNFFRCRTVAWAEQRIHFRLRPRSLLLLHSRQMLTCRTKDTPLGLVPRGPALEASTRACGHRQLRVLAFRNQKPVASTLQRKHF